MSGSNAKRYAISRKSHAKQGGGEGWRDSVIAEFSDYAEAYEAGRRALEEEPKRRVMFLQTIAEDGKTKEYTLRKKAKKAKGKDKADPMKEAISEATEAERYAKEKALRRKAYDKAKAEGVTYGQALKALTKTRKEA